MKKRLISLLLVVVMIVSSIPMTIFVAGATDAEYSALEKTAEWVDGEKHDLRINLQSEDISGRLNGKVLFLGTLCSKHNLSIEKLQTALGVAAMYADVDYYLFKTLKSELQATSQNTYTGTIKKTFKETASASIAEVKKDDLFKTLALAESSHHTIYDFANVLKNIKTTDYDYIIMEFDGFLLGEYNNSNKAVPEEQTEILDAAVPVISQFYKNNKVIWIVPPKEYSNFDFFYDKKYDDDGINANIRASIREVTKLLAPEDLGDDGKVTSEKLTKTGQPTLYSRLSETDDDKKIWTTYGSAADIQSLLERKFGGIKYKKVVITDTLNDGFIGDKAVGYIYNEENKTWNIADKSKFTYTSEGQKFVGTFVLQDIPHTLVKMIIEAHVDEENDPFKGADNHTVETNKGKAKAEYFNTDSDTPRDTYEAVSPKLKRLDCEITTKVTNGSMTYKTNSSESKSLNDEDKILVKDHSGLELENDVDIYYQPDTYYELDYIKVDGEKLSENDLKEYASSYHFEDVDSDHSVEVVYKLPNVTVKFDTHGASSQTPSDQVFGKGGKATKPTDPTKPGYTFKGWTTDEAGQSPYDFSSVVTEDKTLHAQYTENDVTVNYVAYTGGKVKINGESETAVSKSETVKAENGTVKGGVAVPDTGYSFEKWADKEGSTTYTTDTTFVPQKNSDQIYEGATYYAFFKINNYPVTFVMHGHGTNPGGQTVNYGEKATKPADPSENNYEFKGWFTDATYATSFDFNTPITKATDIHAKWVENEITINYVANVGGNVDNASESVKVVSGTPAGSTATASEHYSFVNWTDKDGNIVGTEAKFVPAPNKSTNLYESATYYANFKIDSFKVKFDNKGHGIKPADQDVNYNEKAENPGNLTDEGYDFEGWYVDNECTTPFNFGSTSIVKETTIYAKWTEKHAPLHYVLGDGATGDSVLDDEMYYSTQTKIVSKNAAKEGYIFRGWALSASDAEKGKVAYTVGSTFKNANVVPVETTIYAVWEPIPVPQTGDNSNLAIWAMASIVSLAGLFSCMFVLKKRAFSK